MFSGYRLLLILLMVVGPACPWVGASGEFRVCSDPNNMPFSNRREQGFENQLAQLLAHELGLQVRYFWWPQRRGFVRNTLSAGVCDVIMGVPASFQMAQPTRPYYRSSYVFVSRQDRHCNVHSFDDPYLRAARIGIHVIGDDYANVPPAQALINRGITDNIVGYSIYGDYSKDNPAAKLIEGVSNGDVDVAIAWGPLAGYFAKHAAVPLKITSISTVSDSPLLPFAFDISMAVRRTDKNLCKQLDQAIRKRRADIDKMLVSFGVPLSPVADSRQFR